MSSSSSASSQEYFSAEESIWFTASSNESSQDSMMSDLLGLGAQFLAWWSHFMNFTNVTQHFFEILSFKPIFGAEKVKKLTFFRKMPIFSTSRPPKRAKISKSQKFPSNVCMTHQMEPPCQKLGLKNYLEPKKKHFPIKKVKIFADFSIHFTEKVRVSANFVAPLHDNRESFFDSVKSFWKYITGTFKIT